MTNEEAHEQIRRQDLERQRLESWAATRVLPWRELRADDYDFRSWANGASKEHLQAGCVYEYARESRKLRCLLGLGTRKAASKRLGNSCRPKEDHSQRRIRSCRPSNQMARFH